MRCVRCGQKLELEILKENNEIEEGFLFCPVCGSSFPILSKIPIMWNNFQYFSNRISLANTLYNRTKNQKMKSFLKNSLLKTNKINDRTSLEDRWVKIYQNSKNLKFYS